jgi:UDP-3-O-[3-hydroxymyristoyl] glucosamine N-acyltransferase
LAGLAGVKVAGDKLIKGISTLEGASPDDATFLDFNVAAKGLDHSAALKEKLKLCKAGACFVREDAAELLPSHIIPVIVADPKMAYINAVEYFYKDKSEEPQTTDVHPSATIGEGTKIFRGAIIKAGVVLGKNCIVRENAVVMHTIAGDNVEIGESAVVGSAGFGWHSGAFGHKRMPQLGRVVLGDFVSIGANSCVDRGAGMDTEVGAGTKIDNLVQIAHNCKVGKNCIFAGLSGVAGSVIIEDWVLVGAQAGISGHIRIGAGSQISAQSGVMQNLEPKSIVGGTPSQPARDWMKTTAMLRRMIKNKGSAA